MINNLIYVYCISTSPLDLDHNVEFNDLQSILFEDLYVIVKYVSEDDFSEENFKKNLSDIQWVETNAREHIRVISLIMEYSTVIPFKFGTIFHSKDSLIKFIADYSDSLKENIQNLRNREEWSVKIYCDRKALSQQIDELSEDAATLEMQIMASAPGKAFILKRKKIDLIENEIDRLCKRYGQQYYDEFKSLSESASINNLIPKEFSGREDPMILNATFLVGKNRVDELKNTADNLTGMGDNPGFTIDATGPWPPFSFVSIKEK